MSKKYLLLVLLVALLVGCGRITKEKAARAIEEDLYPWPVNRLYNTYYSYDDMDYEFWKACEKAELARITSTKLIIIITAKGKKYFRREGAFGYWTRYRSRVCDKVLVEVVAVKKMGKKYARVKYTWKYDNFTTTGKLVRNLTDDYPAEIFHAIVELTLYDDGWKITRRNELPLEEALVGHWVLVNKDTEAESSRHRYFSNFGQVIDILSDGTKKKNSFSISAVNEKEGWIEIYDFDCSGEIMLEFAKDKRSFNDGLWRYVNSQTSPGEF